MSFLLLLSAMLSVLTGAVSSGRVERQQGAVIAQVERRQAQPVRAVKTLARPDAGPLRPSLGAILTEALRLTATEPLFASRRRE